MAPVHDTAFENEPGNGVNTFVSYYYFGEAIAAGLDLTIRTKFPGKSLDDWMRAMWRGHSDVDRPYTMLDLERTLGQVTGSPAFAHDVFARYIIGTETMDYMNLLPKGGFAMRKLSPGRVWFGAPHLRVSEQGAEITGPVLRDSPAYLAGLDRGDTVLAVDGKPMKDTKEWSKMLMSHKPGDRSQVRVHSRGLDRLVTLEWQESPELEVVPLEKTGQLTPEARDLRNAWLGSQPANSKALQPLSRR
jgi:predicted metalloprotease with PDZ domain